MKNLKYKLILTLALATICQKAQAQVEFKIQKIPGTTSYVISAVPQVDYPAPQNIVGSAQVTLKVPTGGFEVAEIQNLHGFGRWRVNGRCNAPKESGGFDYLYFGLENLGSKSYTFKKGAETVLFVLKAGGVCTGEVSLMDNKADHFRTPNSARINVGNQMSILGAGGDAYVGNRENGLAECFELEDAAKQFEQVTIFPNPVTDEAFSFGLNNPKAEAVEGSVWLHDMAGRAVFFQKYNFEPGPNQKEIRLENFPIGVYQLVVFGLSAQPMRQTVVKGDY